MIENIVIKSILVMSFFYVQFNVRLMCAPRFIRGAAT